MSNTDLPRISARKSGGHWLILIVSVLVLGAALRLGALSRRASAGEVRGKIAPKASAPR
jgi:hypothetical protein